MLTDIVRISYVQIWLHCNSEISGVPINIGPVLTLNAMIVQKHTV